MASSKELYDFFMSQGLAPHQAAAMVGHAVGESGINPTIQETRADGSKGPGYGLYQWTTPSRRAGLDTFAKSGTGTPLDPNDWKTQALYALHELDTTEKKAGEALYGAKTYDDAVKAGMHFLRPSGYSPDNPMAGHNYAGRFNAGAGLAGASPMMGPAIAAAGDPTGGLLAQPQPQGVDAEIAQWSGMGTPSNQASLAAVMALDQSKKDKALGEASDAALQFGAGLLAPRPEQEWAPAQAQVHRPEMQAQGMPDFTQILAQQRLMRRT